MDVWRITVAALRRWYVLLPLLGVTALMVVLAGRGVQPEYDVTGATMVVPGPALQQVPNPYGGIDDANYAVGIVLNSPEARSTIADQGLIPTYEVAPESRSTIMNFEVRGATPEQAVETGIALVQMAATELRDRQTAAGIRFNQQYSIDVLQTPSVSAAVTDGKLRNMAVIGVLGSAISLAIAVFFDDVVGLVRRRRGRRLKAGEQDSTSDAGPPAEPVSDPTPVRSSPTAAPLRPQDVRASAGSAGRTASSGAPGAPLQPRASAGTRNGSVNQAGQSGTSRKPKQPRKAKKAAAAASGENAASVWRATAVSDA